MSVFSVDFKQIRINNKRNSSIFVQPDWNFRNIVFDLALASLSFFLECLSIIQSNQYWLTASLAINGWALCFYAGSIENSDKVRIYTYRINPSY